MTVQLDEENASSAPKLPCQMT